MDIFPTRKPTREEWLVGIFGRRLLSFQMRQLAVRELSSNIAVVSFVQTETYQQSATPQTDDHFVVDIWINNGNGDNWRCTDLLVGGPPAPPSVGVWSPVAVTPAAGISGGGAAGADTFGAGAAWAVVGDGVPRNMGI